MYDGNYEEMVGSAFSQLLPVLFLLMNDNTLRFNQVFLPNTGEESVLLVDSWGGFKQMAHETDTTKNITIKYIPEGTTGRFPFTHKGKQGLLKMVDGESKGA